MAKMHKLTHERLLAALDYDPATGIFRWKLPTSNRIHIGDRAGVLGTLGYRFITLDREKLQASRLAWFYVHKEWPKGDIVFDNDDTDDCSLSNLSDLSRIEQARRRGAISTNTSGMRGVSPTRRGMWKASITANYHQVMLGVFQTKEEASEIYEHAAAILALAKTSKECEIALEQIIQYRRKRVAWARLLRSGRRTDWTDFDVFCSDVGYMEDEESTVAAVDESKPIGPINFRWLLRPQGKFDRTTKEGRAAYAKAWRDANPNRWRHSHLRVNYQTDEVEVNQIFRAQDGLCAICKQPEDRTKIGGEEVRRLSQDHDHDTRKLRGLLCAACNLGLGYFADDPERLRDAAEYIEAHRPVKSFDLNPAMTSTAWLSNIGAGFLRNGAS